MRARDVTLDAISEDSTQPFTVSSPRSVEALARHGILVEELQFRAFEDFREASVPEELVQMRFEHYETRRRERIKQVQREYRTVCSTPGTASCPLGGCPRQGRRVPAHSTAPRAHRPPRAGALLFFSHPRPHAVALTRRRRFCTRSTLARTFGGVLGARGLRAGRQRGRTGEASASLAGTRRHLLVLLRSRCADVCASSAAAVFLLLSSRERSCKQCASSSKP